MNGITDALLDWNLDLDDIVGHQSPHNSEFRRYSEPASLPSRKSKNLHVKFGNVQVRECERILGDNPACEVGPSLSLGWRYREYQPVSVLKFEATRQKQRRKSTRGFYMTEEKRASIAKEIAGMSVKDIERNIELIGYFHEERNETLMELHRGDGSSKLVQSIMHNRNNGKTSRRQFASLNTFMC